MASRYVRCAQLDEKHFGALRGFWLALALPPPGGAVSVGFSQPGLLGHVLLEAGRLATADDNRAPPMVEVGFP